MRAYNFFSGPKFTMFFSPNVAGVVVVNISSKTKDCRVLSYILGGLTSDRSNSVKREIADRCCPLVNHK